MSLFNRLRKIKLRKKKIEILHTRIGDGLIGELLSTLQLTGVAFGTEEPEPC